MTREVIEIEKKDAGRVHILTGIVTDTGDGVVDVDIDDHGVVSDIPVFYHCPDSETADGNPFSIDDRVIIVNSGGDVDVANMKVIGYEDGLLRSCVWESFSGPDIDSNHPWLAIVEFCEIAIPFFIVDEHLVFDCINTAYYIQGNINLYYEDYSEEDELAASWE